MKPINPSQLQEYPRIPRLFDATDFATCTSPMNPYGRPITERYRTSVITIPTSRGEVVCVNYQNSQGRELAICGYPVRGGWFSRRKIMLVAEADAETVRKDVMNFAQTVKRRYLTNELDRAEGKGNRDLSANLRAMLASNNSIDVTFEYQPIGQAPQLEN